MDRDTLVDRDTLKDTSTAREQMLLTGVEGYTYSVEGDRARLNVVELSLTLHVKGII